MEIIALYRSHNEALAFLDGYRSAKKDKPLVDAVDMLGYKDYTMAIKKNNTWFRVEKTWIGPLIFSDDW